MYKIVLFIGLIFGWPGRMVSIFCLPGGQPNPVLIVANNLGYGDPGCDGQSITQTSLIDGIARGGMRFTQFEADTIKNNPFDFESGAELMAFLRPDSGRLLITAHRGGVYEGLPENTIALFTHTLEHVPTMIETDPRYTKDSMIVLFHDPTLDRTSTGHGKLSGYTYAELKKMSLVDPYGNVSPYKIPTLDETLEWARGKTVLFLDSKDVPAEVRARKILEHEATGYAVVMAYSLEDAEKVYRVSPDIMMQVFVPDDEALRRLERSGIPLKNMIAFVSHRWPDPEFIKKLNHKGLSAIVGSSRTIDKGYLSGSINRKEMSRLYLRLMSLQPDVIEADCPVEAGTILKAWMDYSGQPE